MENLVHFQRYDSTHKWELTEIDRMSQNSSFQVSFGIKNLPKSYLTIDRTQTVKKQWIDFTHYFIQKEDFFRNYFQFKWFQTDKKWHFKKIRFGKNFLEKNLHLHYN